MYRLQAGRAVPRKSRAYALKHTVSGQQIKSTAALNMTGQGGKEGSEAGQQKPKKDLN
jgi:hypothetical protein